MIPCAAAASNAASPVYPWPANARSTEWCFFSRGLRDSQLKAHFDLPRDGIVLIGPAKVGKTTVGTIVSNMLGVSFVSLDELRWDYYEEIGYDANFASIIRTKGGLLSLVLYWKMFDCHAIERMLQQHAGERCIFELGAVSSTAETDEQRRRMSAALSQHTVILLLPSEDREKSIEILGTRTKYILPREHGFDWNRYFVEHRTNYELADRVLYTDTDTPLETCHRILDMLNALQG